MIKEEIREGLANELEQPCSVCELEDNCDCRISGIVCPNQEKKSEQIMRYLDSQGVVLKVEAELPELERSESPIEPSSVFCGGFKLGIVDMVKAGYTHKFERLI